MVYLLVRVKGKEEKFAVVFAAIGVPFDDARFFIEAGIPMLIYGPGPIEKAHKDDEYVTIDSLLKTYKAYG